MFLRRAALLLAFTLSIGAQPRATAIFAGGCFWCMEPPFEKLDGVLSVTSGYTGGTRQNPTYEEVSAGGTGHYEAVLIAYDPRRITYGALLDVFWRNVDYTDGGGQFCDRGDQYRAAIFYGHEAERRLAEHSKRRVMQTRRRNVLTAVLPASRFYPAEEYHQDYSKKNPVRYRFYRLNCGRDARLRAVWGAR